MTDKKKGAAALLRYGHEMFLMLRDDKPDIGWPATWAVFAGAVEEGETADQALDRELREEIFKSQVDLELIGSTDSNLWKMGSINGQQYANAVQREGSGRGVFSFAGLRILQAATEIQINAHAASQAATESIGVPMGIPGTGQSLGRKFNPKGGLGGAILRFMQNAPDEIEKFLATGAKPDLVKMEGRRIS